MRLINDNPEYEWNVNGLKSLLKRIDETGDIDRKKGSGRPKTARTEENIKKVGEMICSQGEEHGTQITPSEIALELDIDQRSVSRIDDLDLSLHPLRKVKVQKLTDADIEKRFTRGKQLLVKYTWKVLEKAFFNDGKIFKVKQQYNSQNDVVY